MIEKIRPLIFAGIAVGVNVLDVYADTSDEVYEETATIATCLKNSLGDMFHISRKHTPRQMSEDDSLTDVFGLEFYTNPGDSSVKRVIAENEAEIARIIAETNDEYPDALTEIDCEISLKINGFKGEDDIWQILCSGPQKALFPNETPDREIDIFAFEPPAPEAEVAPEPVIMNVELEVLKEDFPNTATSVLSEIVEATNSLAVANREAKTDLSQELNEHVLKLAQEAIQSRVSAGKALMKDIETTLASIEHDDKAAIRGVLIKKRKLEVIVYELYDIRRFFTQEMRYNDSSAGFLMPKALDSVFFNNFVASKKIEEILNQHPEHFANVGTLYFPNKDSHYPIIRTKEIETDYPNLQDADMITFRGEDEFDLNYLLASIAGCPNGFFNELNFSNLIKPSDRHVDSIDTRILRDRTVPAMSEMWDLVTLATETALNVWESYTNDNIPIYDASYYTEGLLSKSAIRDDIQYNPHWITIGEIPLAAYAQRQAFEPPGTHRRK